MRKILLMLFAGSFLFFSLGDLKSQNAITGDGYTAGWDPFGSGHIAYFSEIVSGSFGATLQANGTGNQYFRICVDWSGTKTQHTSSPGSDTEVSAGSEILLSSSNTTSGALFTNVTSTSHSYIFKTRDAGTSPSFDLIFFKIEGTVRSISSVSRDITNVYPGQDVVVTSTLDGSLSTGQGVYLRYTDDGFSTSTVVEMSGSGTTYTATITSSINSASSSIDYYTFTSGDGLTIASGNADWYTINLNNNGGANYSYTVAAAHTTKSGATVWSANSSWDAGVVPISDQPVIIEDDISLDQDATVSQLTVNSGKSFNINAGSSLSVSGDLSNSGTFTLKSDGTGKPVANPTGSLIVNGTVTGDITIERNIDGNTGDNGWHYLSSPVDNFVVSGSDFDPNSVTGDLYYYDEVNDLWKNYESSAFNFEKEKGYLCAYAATSVKEFAGEINNSDVSISGLTLTGGGNGSEDGWNLIGNPFTSAIEWNNGSYGLINIFGTAKVWPEYMGNWDDVTASGIIPAMNGFFVKVTSGTGSLTIPTSARTHDATPWYKSDQETLTLKISGGSNDYFDKVRVNFNELATDGLDYEFDSYKLIGLETAPQLFTRLGEEKFSTNTFSDASTERQLDMDFIPGTSGEYTIEVIENTLNNDASVYLQDKVTGQMNDLNNIQSFTFNAEVGDAENRFKLHFGATGVAKIQKEALQAYVSGDQLYILGEEGSAELSIFNIQGQQLLQEQVELNNHYSRTLSLENGIYLLSLQTENKTKTTKVIIK